MKSKTISELLKKVGFTQFERGDTKMARIRGRLYILYTNDMENTKENREIIIRSIEKQLEDLRASVVDAINNDTEVDAV